MRLIGYLFLGLGFICYIFARSYRGSNLFLAFVPFPLAILLALLGVGIIIWKMQLNDRNYQKKLAEFKAKATKIKVRLDDCELKTNSYQEEIESLEPPKVQAYDAMFNHNQAPKKIDVNHTIVLYKKCGRTYLSHPILKDKITLGFIFEKQGYTFIYIDPLNPEIYYFDFEFIEQ